MTKLQEIILNGNTGGLVQYLADGGNPDGEESDLPLADCVKARRSDIAEILLQHGSEVNKKDRETGWTALHQAVYSEQIEICELLLDNGAKQTALTSDYYPGEEPVKKGTTPFMIATTLGNIDFIKILQVTDGKECSNSDDTGALYKNRLPGFNNDVVYAMLVAGKVCDASYTQALSVAGYCKKLADKQNTKLVAVPTCDLSEDSANGKADYSLVVGILVLEVEIPSVYFTEKGKWSGEYGLTSEINDLDIRAIFNRALKLNIRFWRELERVSKGIVEQPVKLYLVSCGPLSQAKVTTPGGQVIEVSSDGVGYIDVVLETGTYILEGQYD